MSLGAVAKEPFISHNLFFGAWHFRHRHFETQTREKKLFYENKRRLHVSIGRRWQNLMSEHSTPRTDKNDLDNLVPHLPLWEAVQDLHSTDPTQESCARTYKIRKRYALNDLDNEVGIDHTDHDLSELWIIRIATLGARCRTCAHHETWHYLWARNVWQVSTYDFSCCHNP